MGSGRRSLSPRRVTDAPWGWGRVKRAVILDKDERFRRVPIIHAPMALRLAVLRRSFVMTLSFAMGVRAARRRTVETAHESSNFSRDGGGWSGSRACDFVRRR